MDQLTPRIWNPARQCTAENRAGERCRRQPIPGGTVCVLHGGAIPGVQAKAKVRLLALVEPIIDVFEEIVDSWKATRCPACGHPTGDPGPVIHVGRLVLDRAGFHPSLTLEQAPPPPNTFEEFTDDQLIEKLEAMLDDLRRRRDERSEGQALLGDGAVDGVVVGEGFEVPEDNASDYDTLTSEADQHAGGQIPLGLDPPEKWTDGK